MTQGHTESVSRAWLHVEKYLEKVLWGLSTWVIPIAIVATSLLALSAWEDLYASEPVQQLEFQALSEAGSALTIETAPIRLADEKKRRQYETKLSELPVWFRVPLAAPVPESRLVEFPSRHIQEISCWDAATRKPLGFANAEQISGEIERVKSWYAVRLSHIEGDLVCKASFQGPARITAFLWSASDLNVSVQDFQRKSGLLDGGVLMLAAFVLIAALINRQTLYIIFAA